MYIFYVFYPWWQATQQVNMSTIVCFSTKASRFQWHQRYNHHFTVTRSSFISKIMGFNSQMFIQNWLFRRYIWRMNTKFILNLHPFVMNTLYWLRELESLFLSIFLTIWTCRVNQSVSYAFTSSLSIICLIFFFTSLSFYHQAQKRTEYSIIESKVLSLIILRVVSKYPCSIRIVLIIFTYYSWIKSLQISYAQSCWFCTWLLIICWHSSSIYEPRAFAYVDKWIFIFCTIQKRWVSKTFWSQLKRFMFPFAFQIIISNIYLLYFTFNSYYYCYFSIYFILLNRFTFLSMVASTESWEKTCRVSSYSIDFFSFSFRVRTFSRIYFLAHNSRWRSFQFSRMDFCSQTCFSESAKFTMKMSWLNLLVKFLC